MTRLMSDLGIALTSIFSFLFLILIAKVTYLILILRHHRNLQNACVAATTSNDQQQHHLPSGNPNHTISLQRFLCWKTQSRVKPASHTMTSEDSTDAQMTADDTEDEEAVDIGELLKQQQNSRLLFTIKEEDREGIDSSMERSKSISSTTTCGWRKEMMNRSATVSSWDSAGDTTELTETARGRVSLLVLLAIERAEDQQLTVAETY